MAFRDELGAAQARADSLARRVDELEEENLALREAPDDAPEPTKQRSIWPVAVGVLVVGGTAAGLVGGLGYPVHGAITAVLTVGVFIQLAAVAVMVKVVPPGFALVVSGRRHFGPGGVERGYRVVTSGRTIPMPMLETVDRLDLRPRAISGEVSAYLKASERASLRFTGSIKLARVSPAIDSAIERFLGRDLSEVERVASETIEGAIRSSMAQLTLAEAQTDAEKVSALVLQEAEPDLLRCGIEIDSLSVSPAD